MNLKTLLALTLLGLHTTTHTAWPYRIVAAYPVLIHAAHSVSSVYAARPSARKTFTQAASSSPVSPQDTITKLSTKKGIDLELLTVKNPQPDGPEMQLVRTHFKWVNDYVCKRYQWARAQIVTPADSVIAGVALYSIKDRGETSIEYLTVAPTHQNKGIGEALIEYVSSITQCHKITLESLAPSRSFYIEKLGFSPTYPGSNYLFKNRANVSGENVSVQKTTPHWIIS